MAEPEERLLEDYFRKMAAEAEEISDVKLDTAIRKGMQGGNRKRISLRRGYTVLLLAIVAIALFIIVPWANQFTKPERAQLPPKSWGELEVFRPIVEDNITIRSALDAGFVQQVNITSSVVNGIQMTINGVIVDKRGVILLYTFENDTDQKVQNFGFTLKEAEDAQSIIGSGFSGISNYEEQGGSPGQTREFVYIPWSMYMDRVPDQIVYSLSLAPENLKVSSENIEESAFKLSALIDLDEKAEYAQGKYVNLDESITIAGQIINLNNIYIGPTGIYMREVDDEFNTMEIFSLLKPKLMIGELGNQEELSLVNSYSRGYSLATSIYHNDNMRPDDPIQLEIEGITALDKSKLELVINTETRQILKAPNEYFTFSKRTDNEEQGVFSLELFTPKNDEKSLTGSFFSIDENFVDNTGSGHWLERVYDNDGNGYKERGDTKGSTTSAVFNVGKDKLPQPLTFKFTSYPNVVMESATLRIK